MGNETSSMKIHSLLTAEDIKALRVSFPGGGASATPITTMNWGAWKEAWPENRRQALEDLIKAGGENVAFQAYQELAGRFVRGTTEERTKLIFKLVAENDAQTITVSQKGILAVLDQFESSIAQCIFWPIFVRLLFSAK
jgi:hypothetical protein